MKVLLLVLAVSFVLVFGIVVVLTAVARATCADDANAAAWGWDGPGSLGGVAGTGITAAEYRKVKQHPYAGGNPRTGEYIATAYAPAAGGINCGSDCSMTSTGVPVNGGKRRLYAIAVDPQLIPYGSLVYVTPNPWGYDGPFMAIDTGGAIQEKRIDIYIWGDAGEALSNKWGRRPVQITTKSTGSSNASSAPASGVMTPTMTNGVKFRRPTTGPITSPFGPRWGRLHAGVDFGAGMGKPIVAARSGRVIFAGVAGGYGNYVCIRHEPRLTTCYGHQSRLAAASVVGNLVSQSQVIGYVGSTGNSTGPHLHFEVRRGPATTSPPVDPMPYLKGAESIDAQEPGDTGDQCPAVGDGLAIDGSNLVYPALERGHSLGGVAGHGSRAWGNWQSDNAVDIGLPMKTPIVAVDDGTITKLGGGWYSMAANPNGWNVTLTTGNNEWFYTHLYEREPLRVGQKVRAGQRLGFSGGANGVLHLHIASKQGDPERLLRVPK